MLKMKGSVYTGVAVALKAVLATATQQESNETVFFA